LAFLDLTCCGFGCALLLLLLVAAANPEPPKSSPRNAVMLLRCEHRSGPKPEIRIECRRPGRYDWERVDRFPASNPPEAFEFTAPAEKDGGGESFVVFYNPKDGLWTFRAHLVGFPKDRPVGPVELAFAVEGEGVELIASKPPPALVWPGEFTPPVDVLISREW
jgi:hypothetical protein